MFSAGSRLVGAVLLASGWLLVLAGVAVAARYVSPEGVVYVADPAQVGAGATVTGYEGGSADLSLPAKVSIEGVDYRVRTIRESAFRDTQLTSVRLSESLWEIRGNAFAENDLTSLVIPDSVRLVGGASFFNNPLTEVRFGRSVATIGNFAFSNSSLSAVTIPAAVTAIGEESFSNNHQLRRVTFRGPAPTTFTAKGPRGSLGDGNDPLVLYDPQFAGSNERTGFTRPRWRGYRSSPAWFVVRFDTGGHGTPPDRVRVPYSGSLDRPTEPSAPGWNFDGWYVDPGGGERYRFASEVTEDLTLHARWVQDPQEPGDPGTDTPTDPGTPPSTDTDPTPPSTPGVTPGVTPAPEGGASEVALPSRSPAPSETAPEPEVRVDAAAEERPDPDPAGDPAGVRTDRSDPAAPSAVTDTLPSLKDVVTDPSRVIRAFSSGFVLSLIVFLIAGVLNRLLERRSHAWSAWLARRPGLRALALGVERWVEANPMRSAVVVTGISGGVMAAVDPEFGWDLVSLRLVASAVAAILVGLVGCLWLVGRIAGRRLRIAVVVRGIPLGVLLAVAGVLASRLLDFQPGFLVGAIIGLTVAGGEPQVARVEELRATLTLVIAGAAWVATDLVDPGGLVSVFASDALVVVVTALLCGLLLRLLPAPGFPGAVLLRHARAKWVVLFTSTAAAFMTIVLPRPGNWLYVGDHVARWLLLAGLFAALTLAFYVLEVRHLRRERTGVHAR